MCDGSVFCSVVKRVLGRTTISISHWLSNLLDHLPLMEVWLVCVCVCVCVWSEGGRDDVLTVGCDLSL